MADLGYIIDVDGQYGGGTAAVVRQFKNDQGLALPPGLTAHDGVTGPGTMRRLDELYAGETGSDAELQAIVDARLAEVAGTAQDPGLQIAALVRTSDGHGAMATCQRGLVCVTPAEEACIVLDPIAMHWAVEGAEAGLFGYPTGDSAVIDGRLVQDFSGGGMVAPDGPAPEGIVHAIDLPVCSRWHEPIGGFEPGWPMAAACRSASTARPMSACSSRRRS